MRLFWLLVFVVPLSASADVVLYDAAAGSLPGAQGWNPVMGASSTQTYLPGLQLTELDTTTDRTDQSGYFSEEPFVGAFEHPNMVTLDRASGFTIRFDLQVLAENHNTRDDNVDGLDDRAGFSVITISQDLLGLELAFFEDRVWAYAAAGEGTNSLFTQAESVLFDTTAGVVQYDLSVSNTTYTLFQNSQFLLSGALRNYNPSGVNPFADPYDNPSFLFFGDDTTSADSQVHLGAIEILERAVIPEPGVLHLALAGCLMVWGIRRRRRASR
jgi:hypothetical protein